MDLDFRYSNNTSPNFGSIFKDLYERASEKRQKSKSESNSTPPKKADDAPEPKPSNDRWNPVNRGREANDRHAQQTKSSAESLQTYTGKATRATEAKPVAVRPATSSRSRQWSVVSGERDRRRALPYSGEQPGEAPMGKHAKKPMNPADRLGRHAAGQPPKNEASGPQKMGRHAKP
jgi:hypothetical protein